MQWRLCRPQCIDFWPDRKPRSIYRQQLGNPSQHWGIPGEHLGNPSLYIVNIRKNPGQNPFETWETPVNIRSISGNSVNIWETTVNIWETLVNIYEWGPDQTNISRSLKSEFLKWENLAGINFHVRKSTSRDLSYLLQNKICMYCTVLNCIMYIQGWMCIRLLLRIPVYIVHICSALATTLSLAWD